MLNRGRVRPPSLCIGAVLVGAVFFFGCKEIPTEAPFKLPEMRREAKHFAPMPPAEDPKYPRYDPYQPLYQGSRFWRHRKSAPPTKKVDWRELHKIELSNLGFEMLKYGAVAAVLGIAFCLSVQNELADAFGAFVAAAGLISIGFGMGFLWISEVWQWIVYGLTCTLVVWLFMRFRGRGVKIRRSKVPCKTPSEPVQ
jgi:hypothetical protein